LFYTNYQTEAFFCKSITKEIIEISSGLFN